MHDFVKVYTMVRHIILSQNVQDDISWRWTASGNYTTKLAYEVQFLGALESPFQKLFWNIWAPQKCKNFTWLLIQHRLPTADVLTRRYMQNDHWCPLCTDNPETTMHMFVVCSYIRLVWSLVAIWVQHVNLNPSLWTLRMKMVD